MLNYLQSIVPVYLQYTTYSVWGAWDVGGYVDIYTCTMTERGILGLLTTL